MGGYYDVAQVCPNGHVANDSTQRSPQFNKKHCEKCGEATLFVCPACGTPIQGEYHAEGVISIGFEFDPPAFCHNCGSAFPWTVRRQQAALELFCEENHDEKDRAQFKESVAEIAKDSPQSQVASKRVRKLLGNLGKQTASVIQDIVVSVASESAKKFLIGP